MASPLHTRWDARFEGMSRRDRQGCWYDAYLPDPLMGWEFSMPGDVAADVADAEAAVRRLNDSGTRHVSLEGLARFLLRAESVASSKIEGLEVAAQRLARAEAALGLGAGVDDRTAVEVIGNIATMEDAVLRASSAGDFELTDLLAIHRRLMDGSPSPDLGGVVRQEQSWIGGSSFNPCSAAFVPPPPEHLDSLLTDLLTYLGSDDHSPLVQALIHVVLRRRGLAPRFVPPLSLVLATWSKDYVEGLTAFRHLADPDSPERSEAASRWLRIVASATTRDCVDAERYSAAIAELDHRWRAAIGRVRAGSGTDLLLGVLPGAPIVTVESASALIGRSKARATDAVNALAAAGVLTQRDAGRQRYRVFEATDVLDLFTSLERGLATPGGDTRSERPARRVPAPGSHRP